MRYAQEPSPAIVGVGTAVPAAFLDQAAAAEHYLKLMDDPELPVAVVRKVFDLVQVESRCVSVSQLLDSTKLTMGARIRAYEELAPRLAIEASRKALQASDLDASEITHIVVVTCTGFSAPGVDIELIRKLGLRQSVKRTMVGFHGCQGAFNGLEVALNALVAKPESKVLAVCVELPSLHARGAPNVGNFVAQGLFADGAAAFVLRNTSDDSQTLAKVIERSSHVELGTEDHLQWHIGDNGFEITLSKYVPQLIGEKIGEFVSPLVENMNGKPLREVVDSWCVHPGGMAILDRVEEALGLKEEALSTSRGVLRGLGNMSSATIMFVLDRELELMQPGTLGIMLAFGPGLSFEGVSFERGSKPWRSAAPAEVQCDP